MTKHGFADATQTERYEEDGAWIEIRTGFSKHDDAVITDNSGFTRIATDEGMELRPQAVKGDRTIFALLVTAWSLSANPTADEYDKLSAKTGQWVDKCLADAIAKGRGEIEGKDDSPARPSDSPSSSQEEASPPSTG